MTIRVYLRELEHGKTTGGRQTSDVAHVFMCLKRQHDKKEKVFDEKCYVNLRQLTKTHK